MEQNSQNRVETDRTMIEGHLRESYARVVYSHKTHEKCADILLDRFSTIKFWQIVLSALSSAGFVGALLGDHKEAAGIIGLIISTILLIINSHMKNYDLGELAQKHKDAANDLWLIREKYLSLIVEVRLENTSLENVIVERNELLNQLHSVYKGAPATNFKGYKKAQEALQKLEDMTFKDNEIDLLLPRDVRR